MASMRSVHSKQSSMFCLATAESPVPQHHPLRTIKTVHEVVLKELSPTFDTVCSPGGRQVLAANGYTIR